MARNRAKAKGRREKGSFASLPHSVLWSQEYAELSAIAVKLLVDLLGQYTGKNNGDLTATWKVMQRRGWKSKDTLYRALGELQDTGFLIVARQGGRNRCSLYALTFLAIDECKGKTDIKPTATPPGFWRSQIKSCGPIIGANCPGYRA